jgi:hypothetical protein
MIFEFLLACTPGGGSVGDAIERCALAMTLKARTVGAALIAGRLACRNENGA